MCCTYILCTYNIPTPVTISGNIFMYNIQYQYKLIWINKYVPIRKHNHDVTTRTDGRDYDFKTCPIIGKSAHDCAFCSLLKDTCLAPNAQIPGEPMKTQQTNYVYDFVNTICRQIVISKL